VTFVSYVHTERYCWEVVMVYVCESVKWQAKTVIVIDCENRG